mgnify:CR=1 FL=1
MHDANRDGFLDEDEVRRIYSTNPNLAHLQVDAEHYIREIWQHSDVDGELSNEMVVVVDEGGKKTKKKKKKKTMIMMLWKDEDGEEKKYGEDEKNENTSNWKTQTKRRKTKLSVDVKHENMKRTP